MTLRDHEYILYIIVLLSTRHISPLPMQFLSPPLPFSSEDPTQNNLELLELLKHIPIAFYVVLWLLQMTGGYICNKSIPTRVVRDEG